MSRPPSCWHIAEELDTVDGGGNGRSGRPTSGEALSVGGRG